jgi:hypothetical protein
MAEYRFRHLLQAIAVLTQFPPFTWLYRAAYGLALLLGVRRLRGIAGVRSIYLRRGPALGRAFYGLSDLDLLAIVTDERDTAAVTRVQREYDRLSGWVPLFAPGELQVFGQDQFRSLHEQSMFWRNRFEQGRQEWKLLHGQDVFEGLAVRPADAGLLARQDLGPAWFYLLQCVLAPEPRPAFLRRYVLFKKLADWARATLLAHGIEVGFAREEILERAAAQFPEIAETLLRVRRWRDNFLSTGPDPAVDVLHAYLVMARSALRAGADRTAARPTMKILAAPCESVRLFLGESAIQATQAALGLLEGIDRTVLVPRLSFDPIALVEQDPSGLAGATIDVFDLALIGRQFPPPEALRQFNGRIEQFRPVLIPFFCDPEIALPLQPVRRLAQKDPRSTPEFFQCLSNARPFAGKIELADQAMVQRPLEPADALARRAGTLLDHLAGLDIAGMSVLRFYWLFWESLRAAYLASQTSEGVIEVPVTSQQVVEAAIRRDPSQAGALAQAHREYCRVATGQGGQARRHVDWAKRYAMTLRDRLLASDVLLPRRSGSA